jgi:hypothetical protein
MSLVAISLPTLWLAPPPGFAASSHDPNIEPASIAISAIFASLVVVLVAVIISKKNRGSFLDDTSEHIERMDKHLTISGPLEDVLRRNNATDHQPTPRLWSGFSSSNSDIVRRDHEVEGKEAAASRGAFELASKPVRTPIFHITAPHLANAVELEVRLNYSGSSSKNNALLQTHSAHTARRYPHSEFGDDSTVVGDKAEVETLRSDPNFPDTDSDNASYDERQWKLMDNKALGLLGRHWE